LNTPVCDELAELSFATEFYCLARQAHMLSGLPMAVLDSMVSESWSCDLSVTSHEPHWKCKGSCWRNFSSELPVPSTVCV